MAVPLADHARLQTPVCLHRYSQAIVNAKRDVVRAETQIEALKGKRHDYLKKCKVEEIEIPLSAGSLDRCGLTPCCHTPVFHISLQSRRCPRIGSCALP